MPLHRARPRTAVDPTVVLLPPQPCQWGVPAQGARRYHSLEVGRSSHWLRRSCARSLGVAASPLIAAPLFLSAAFAWTPFVIAGGLKIAYDLLLYRAFKAHRSPEEVRAEG